jgi:hypothetical protein
MKDYKLYAIDEKGREIQLPTLREICEQDGFAHNHLDIRIEELEKLKDAVSYIKKGEIMSSDSDILKMLLNAEINEFGQTILSANELADAVSYIKRLKKELEFYKPKEMERQ